MGYRRIFFVYHGIGVHAFASIINYLLQIFQWSECVPTINGTHYFLSLSDYLLQFFSGQNIHICLG